MFSERKSILAVLGKVAAFGAVAGFACGVLLRIKPAQPATELMVYAALALALLELGAVAVLTQEFVVAAPVGSLLRGNDGGLSSLGVSEITRFASVPQKVGGAVGFFVVLAVALLGGAAESDSASFDGRAAYRWMWALSGAYLLALPVLGSARRMAGSYEEQFRLLPRCGI